MDLIIKEAPVCIAYVDLGLVRDKLKEGKELDVAVAESASFEEDGKVRYTDALKLLYNQLNWKDILRLTRGRCDVMRVQFHMVEYFNKVTYFPMVISSDKTRVSLEEKRLRGQGLILLHNVVNSAEFAIKEFIDSDTFRYGSRDRKWVVIENKIDGGGK